MKRNVSEKTRWLFRWAFLLTICIVTTAHSVRLKPVSAIATNAELYKKAQMEGRLRVIVELDVPFEAEGSLTIASARHMQQRQIFKAQNRVINQMAATNMRTVAQFTHIPFIAVEVTADGLAQLATLPTVVSIQEDEPIPAALDESIPLIGADRAWTEGYTGKGQAIAILDTGVDLDHPAFTTGGSRIVAQGCYSTTDVSYGSRTLCPDGADVSTALGSGADCTLAATGFAGAQADCTHGTHVAGIAAGNDGTIAGVAKEADIIAIQIFSLFTSSTYCGGAANCALSYTSDQILALERVYELRETFNIAAVNMSLGGSAQHTAACDSDSRKAAIDNLRSVGIATVISSGNNGFVAGISKPACISTAVSVGATDNADQIAVYTNVAPMLDILAPGANILAAVPNNTYSVKSGTSMAAPHVAGAWALYKEAVPNASVDDVLAAFQSSGSPINDSRSNGVETNIPRLNVDVAIAEYVPRLTIEQRVSHPYALPGETVTYTIAVRNTTTQAATNVVITDLLPYELILDPTSLSDDARVLDTVDGPTIEWATGQTLVTGEMIQRTFSGVIDPMVDGGTRLWSIASTNAADMIDLRADTAVIQIISAASCDYSESFETATLTNAWSIETDETGRVTLVDQLPYAGSQSLLLDDAAVGGSYSQASAILTVDLQNQLAATLDFYWHDLADEYHDAYDGVFIRETPNHAWIKVYHFSGNTIDDYQFASLDLHTLAEQNGLQFTDRFQIMFGFYDNYPANFENTAAGDGYLIDEIALTCTPHPWSFTQTVSDLSVEPGQVVTVTLGLSNHPSSIDMLKGISTDLSPHWLLAAPPTLLQDDKQYDLDAFEMIASDFLLPVGEIITVTFPLQVGLGLKGGTALSIVTELLDDLNNTAVSAKSTGIVLNMPPIMPSEQVTTTHNTPLTVYPLTNAYDANDDQLMIIDLETPTHGVVELMDNDGIRYTPSPTFSGVDVLHFAVSDGAGGVARSTITAHVLNAAPTAQDDLTASVPNQPLFYPVLVNDFDANLDTLSLMTVESPSNGAAAVSGEMIVYTSTADFEGTAVVPYTISDGNGGEATATLHVEVSPSGNAVPLLLPDSTSIDRDTAVTLDVLANDFDPNQDALTVVSVTPPQFGTAVIIENMIQYTPLRGFVGIEQFTYAVEDARGARVETAVSITVVDVVSAQSYTLYLPTIMQLTNP